MADNMNKNYGKIPGLGRAGGGHQRFAPTAKPKNARGTLLRLLRIFMKWRLSLLVAVVLTILSSTVSIFTPLLIGKAVNTFDIKTNLVDTYRLTVILLALLACYATSWIIDTINGILMAKVTQRLVKHIRFEFFSKLQIGRAHV